jgi:O-acetyl-ADP-ribose deacetylase (regulator of RNase III)
VYGYPVEAATQVAVRTVREALERSGVPIDVIFCCFSENDLSIYEAVLAS